MTEVFEHNQSTIKNILNNIQNAFHKASPSARFTIAHLNLKSSSILKRFWRARAFQKTCNKSIKNIPKGIHKAPPAARLSSRAKYIKDGFGWVWRGWCERFVVIWLVFICSLTCFWFVWNCFSYLSELFVWVWRPAPRRHWVRWVLQVGPRSQM